MILKNQKLVFDFIRESFCEVKAIKMHRDNLKIINGSKKN